MTIPTGNTNRVPYAGNGTTTVFSYPYKFLADADLKVLLVTDATGAQVEQTLTTHYTVSGAGTDSSGQVTMITAPAVGETLVIYADPDIAQATDFVNGGGLNVENIENALDELTIISRRLVDRLNRVARQPDGDTADIATLPSKVDRAGKLMSFDVNGDPVATVGDPGTATGLQTSLANTTSASQGDAMIGVKRTATGAAATDLHAWMENQYINPDADFGAAGDFVSDDTTKLQAALDAMSDGDTLILNNHYLVSGSGLTITNKNRIRITGKGKLQFSGGDSNGMLLKLVGTCDDVEISGITLVGDDNTGYTQTGIGNNTGQTLSNIRCHHCKIFNINVGVSFGGTTGTYSNISVRHNIIYDAVGNGSGQGYGIAMNSCLYSDITENKLNDCGRHSIYVSGGTLMSVRGNWVTNHRLTEAVGSGILRAACSIARSSFVEVHENVFYNCFDSTMGVEAVDGDSTACSHIDVHHNKFYSRGDFLPALYVGEQIVGGPVTYYTRHVTIHENEFYDEYAKGGANPILIIQNGSEVDVTRNKLTTTGVTGTARHITVGHLTYVGDVLDVQNLRVSDNEHYFEGSTLTDTRANIIDVDVSTTYSPNVFVGRLRAQVGCSTPVAFDGAWTNTNLIVEDPVGVRIGVYADGDSTPSVKGINRLRITNSVATDITTLDDMEDGQIVNISVNDANTTFKVSGFYLTGNVDWNLAANDELTIQKVGSQFKEIARMDY